MVMATAELLNDCACTQTQSYVCEGVGSSAEANFDGRAAVDSHGPLGTLRRQAKAPRERTAAQGARVAGRVARLAHAPPPITAAHPR